MRRHLGLGLAIDAILAVANGAQIPLALDGFALAALAQTLLIGGPSLATLGFVMRAINHGELDV